jgi:hypothetical protein
LESLANIKEQLASEAERADDKRAAGLLLLNRFTDIDLCAAGYGHVYADEYDGGDRTRLRQVDGEGVV